MTHGFCPVLLHAGTSVNADEGEESDSDDEREEVGGGHVVLLMSTLYV